MFDWLRSKASSWKEPETTGPPVVLRAFKPSDIPLAKSAKWLGSELEVRSDEAAIKSLFDLLLPQVEQCVISYRFLISSDTLKSAVYPQMWCRIPEKGQFFSQGIGEKISGTNEWLPVAVPFYLEAGQVADLLHLNLAFEGTGVVRLKNVEVTSAPIK